MNSRTGLVVVLSAFLALVTLPAGAEDRLDLEARISEYQKAVHATGALAATTRRVGKVLLKGVTDEQAPIVLRSDCARALGEIRFSPAIPKLIELIELRNPKVRFSETLLTRVYPCLGALTEFRFASMPFVVEAYVKEGREKKRNLLVAVIMGGRTHVRAAAYAKGLAGELKGKEMVSRMKSFLKWLSDDLGSPVPSPLKAVGVWMHPSWPEPAADLPEKRVPTETAGDRRPKAKPSHAEKTRGFGAWELAVGLMFGAVVGAGAMAVTRRRRSV